MLKNRHITSFLAILCLLISHSIYAQFGPGGVGDNGEFVLWLHHEQLPNITRANPSWNDISGYDNHALTIPLGIPQIQDNVFGTRKGAQFFGFQFLAVVDATELNFNDQLAFAAAFTRTGTDITHNRFILTKGAETGNQTGFSLGERSAHIKARLSDGVTEYYDSVSYSGTPTPSFALINYSQALQEFSINNGLDMPSNFSHVESLGSMQNSENLVIGGGPFGNIMDNWIGSIGEIVVFNRKLNIAEEIILENYLSTTFSVPTERDYYAFDKTHSYELAGIGRVDGANMQTDAKGLGMVRIDQASDLQDGEYLLWGHDNNKFISGNTEENVWRIDQSGGDPGTIRTRFYLKGYGISHQSEVTLLVSNSQNFGNATVYNASNWNAANQILTFENTNFSDGNYFTIQLNISNGSQARSATAPPLIDQCPTDINLFNDPGDCGAIVTWVPPTSNGTLTSTHNPGDFFNPGTTTVTYTATNIDGTATCSFDVTIIDNELPVISNCPSNIALDAASSCNSIATWTIPTVTDNCSASLGTSHNPGDTFPLGTTTVTYTATDGAGNSTSCSFDVTILDRELPILSNCPSDITLSASASCNSVATWAIPTVTDNCSASLSTSHNPGDTFPLGTTTVTYTALDGSGNTAVCSFDVTIMDNDIPIITNCTPEITVTDFQSGTNDAIATWTEPLATDNCSLSSFNSSHDSGDRFPIGTTLVTYTATDFSGNTTSCSFPIIIISQVNTPPTIESQAISINAGETVTVCISAADEEGDAITLNSVDSNGLQGSVSTINQSTLCFQYTAPGEYLGTESINFTICDDGDPQECAQGALQISVEMVWELEVSQIITPNNDGINDIWHIGNIDKHPNNTVMIFDRWGSLVYKSSNYNNDENCWAGETTQAKHIAPPGTYFYQIQVENGGNYKGFIELVNN